MNSILTSLPALMPAICLWVEKQEALFLEKGAPLTEGESADAVRAGVKHPEKVRVARITTLPEPDDGELLFLARQVGLFSPRSSSVVFGYGIALSEGHWDNRKALIHECVHVGQAEKMGTRQFLTEYLRECVDPGYPFGRLEQEARRVADDICREDK